MAGMDNATHAPQATSPFGFDSTGLAEMLADAITARIAEELNSDGLVDQTELRAVVDEHAAGALQSLTEDGLTPVLEIAHEMIDAARAREEQLLVDPRHPNAPVVTGRLSLQHWQTGHKGDYRVTIQRDRVLIPAAWLAGQDRAHLLRTAVEHPWTDWIVEDLGWLGDHDGPFELELDRDEESGKNLLQLWLEATAVGD